MRISAIRRFNSGVAHSSTPSKLGTTDGVLRYLDESGRDNSTFNSAPPPLTSCPGYYEEIEPWVDKYVDDVNAGERHFLLNAASTFSQNKEQKVVHVRKCQETFENIQLNANAIVMKVKAAKTSYFVFLPPSIVT